MRPDLSDMIAGVQRLLLQDVLPRLEADPYLQEQVGAAGMLLEFVKNSWARAHLHVTAEHEDLTRTLRALRELLASQSTPELRGLRDEVAGVLDATAAPAASELALDQILERDRRLAGGLSRCIEVLDLPDPPDAGARPVQAADLEPLRALIDGYLARHARRRQAWVGPLGISW